MAHRLTEAQEDFVLAELKVFEAIAHSLRENVGNETTIELAERLKDIKQRLNLPDWPVAGSASPDTNGGDT